MVFKKDQHPWNYGLTKKTDERVKKNDKSRIKTFIEKDIYKKNGIKRKGTKQKLESIKKMVRTRKERGNYKNNEEQIKKIKTTWNNKTEKEIQYIQKKCKQTRIKKGLQIPDKLLPKFELYKRKVTSETNKWKEQLFNSWNDKCFYTKKRLIIDKGYNHPLYPVIDHKTSIFYGFNNNINPSIIGNIDNLCICSRHINAVKGYDIEVKQ